MSERHTRRCVECSCPLMLSDEDTRRTVCVLCAELGVADGEPRVSKFHRTLCLVRHYEGRNYADRIIRQRTKLSPRELSRYQKVLAGELLPKRKQSIFAL